MKVCFALIIGFFSIPEFYVAQVGIGTTDPHSSAILDMTATRKGFLLPRANLKGTDDNTTIPNPANGLLLFNLAAAGSGSTAVLANSLYFRQNAAWRRFALGTDVKVAEFSNQYVLKSTANQPLTVSEINNLNTNPATEVPITWTAGEIFLDSTDDLDLQTDNQTVKVITAGNYRVLANFTFLPARNTSANNDNYSNITVSVMVSKNGGTTWTAVSGAAMQYDVGASNLIQTIILPRTILNFAANDLIRVIISKSNAPDLGAGAGIIAKSAGDTTKLFRMRRLNLN